MPGTFYSAGAFTDALAPPDARSSLAALSIGRVFCKAIGGVGLGFGVGFGV